MILRAQSGKQSAPPDGPAGRADGPARTLQEELLHLLARQARRVPIPVFLVAVVIAAMAAQHVPDGWPLAWLSVVALVLTLRWYVLGRLPSLATMSVEKRLRLAAVLSGINGITHGLSLFFFWELEDFERAVQSMLLIGLCAGSVSTTAGYMPVFLAYNLPTLLPLAVLWGMGTVYTSSWVEGAAALLFVFLGVVLFLLAQDAFRLLRESFEVRQANMRFIDAADHDLRQPLSGLRMLTTALSIQPADQRGETIKHMNSSLSALTSGFDALFAIYKHDAGAQRVNKTTVEIGALLELVCDTLAAAADQKGLELVIECPPGLHVNTDSTLFERVLRNLLDNAIKYTPAGRVTLQARADGDYVEVVVADTGPGIPEDKQPQIFDESVRLENAERGRVKGLGLGLSIVRRYVESLDIGLELISAPGAGTKFVLTLERAALVTEAAVAPIARPEVSLHGLHVLVVEDEARLRSATKVALEHLGCRVSDAAGSDQAARTARADRPDIVLADFDLRDEGLAAVRAVREICPYIPALVVSGDSPPQQPAEPDLASMRLLSKADASKSLTEEIARASGRLKQEPEGLT